MARPGDVVTLTIERPAVGGPMIGRVDGAIVLVTGAIPGERVRARIDRVARKVMYATTVSVDEASPDRRQSDDDPLCGGSLYSHMAYARQLEVKRQVILDAFARLARIDLRLPVTMMPSREDGYRMRARLHIRGRRIGFFREGTHQICDVRQSRQLLPATAEALDRVAAAAASLGDVVREIELSENVEASERVVHLETAEPVDSQALATIANVDGMTPPPYVTDVLQIENRSITFRRHVQAFFQGNRYLLCDLLAHVMGLVPTGAVVIDLYAGSGLFSIAAAALRNATATAVEGDRFAAEDLRTNVAASASRVTPVRSDVEAFVRGVRIAVGGVGAVPAADVVIVDPPRTGVSSEALGGIVALRPPRLVYVSCDIATLARDARRVVDAGYTIQRMDGFDLFPNTPHVETIAVFES